MKMIGVIEGFFGPQWPEMPRLSYADFMSQYGGDFYIYAPKQDPHLRKKWREPWDEAYRARLGKLVKKFHDSNIKFGVGFSPFGLGEKLSDEDKEYLRDKLQILQSLKIDIVGLFFDDMPVSPNLAKTQILAMEFVQTIFKNKIIFCPSFYTPDPILDKVFGKRPENYLEEIADNISPDVAVAWTGPKVISTELPDEHLIETSAVLKRKPFVWENIFANDGPKNCKFLKLKPFSGRTHNSLQLSEGFGFNMMNQPELSKLLYLSSLMVLKKGLAPEAAFDFSLSELCSPLFAEFIRTHKETFLTKGLDAISENERGSCIDELRNFPDLGAKEIISWLSGEYNVGSECLTD